MATGKLYEYEGLIGRLHGTRDSIKERWVLWKDNNPDGIAGYLKRIFSSDNNESNKVAYEDFSHIYRRKTRCELVRISAAVMGIEFSYAAETAFVSPTLLKIGIQHKHMTLVWALSPLIGFFLTPILGSLSDRCHLNYGRRRPFIFIMSLGVLLGLILVPNGELIGYSLGDPRPSNTTPSQVLPQRIISTQINEYQTNETIVDQLSEDAPKNYHPWGIVFTVLGTALLDFDADACQSPARAYLLDVTIPEDHARGLSTFTIMAGLGGFFGYALGGIDWDATFIGLMLGGHVRAVFTLITIIFVICVAYTITSFKEMPLRLLELRASVDDFVDLNNRKMTKTYGSLNDDNGSSGGGGGGGGGDEHEHFGDTPRQSIAAPPPDASFLIYLKSIIYMPYSIRILCLTNLFCWMAHVCYSLYFTDFVGEAVFNGNPIGVEGDTDRELYEQGVRFGCWGMSMYSLSCAFYSMIIESLIQRLGAKIVYVGGLLFYSTGMCLMAITKHKISVIVFSWTAGVMYSTLFTMPYLLIANYHAKGTFEINADGGKTEQIRGLGTDVAIVSSMVFLAQFILSICMGTIVNLTGTTTAVVSVASFLAFCGALSATQVMYLDL